MPRRSFGQLLLYAGHVYFLQMLLRFSDSWSRGVTVSTLDSESSDRGSNPRETCACQLAAAMSRNVPGRSIADCLQACKQWPITCPGRSFGHLLVYTGHVYFA